MTCDVTSDEVADAVEIILSGSFSAYDLDSELKILDTSSVEDDGSLLIVNSDAVNRIASAWFRDTIRLADGFSATFTLNIEVGNSDGLGFIVQNDAIIDAFSSGGDAVGFSGALTRYLLVAFDACSDREADTPCTERNIRLETSDENGSITELISVSIADGTTEDFSDSSVEATVQYLGETVLVFVNGVEVLSFDGVDLETLFGSKFAFLGFSASNSDSGEIEGASISVDDLSVIQMISGSRLDDDSLQEQRVEFGKVVAFEYILVDTCNDKLTENIPDPDVTIASLSAFLSAQDVERDDLEPTIQVSDEDNATFTISFTTPIGVESTWDLTISLDGVLAQGMPLEDIVDTSEADAGGLDPLGVGLLIALIIVLLIGVMYIVRGMYKYRKKLKEHKEDIDYGKTKKKIDEIDQIIEYEMNPLVAPLDQLKERLAINEEKIRLMKEGQKDAVDSAYTVQQLQDQNEKLRIEMNDLKKKQELENAGNRLSAKFGAKLFGQNKGKKDFDQEGN